MGKKKGGKSSGYQSKGSVGHPMKTGPVGLELVKSMIAKSEPKIKKKGGK